MPPRFPDRRAALAFLRGECPVGLRHVFDDANALSLLEPFFEAATSEKLLSTISQLDTEGKKTAGHQAYIRGYEVVVNFRKAGLLSAVLLLDVFVTQGLASLLVSQVIGNPQCIRRITSDQHLACVLNHRNWSTLDYDQFYNSLAEGRCKNPGFKCKFRDENEMCGLSVNDFQNSQAELKDFLKLG